MTKCTLILVLLYSCDKNQHNHSSSLVFLLVVISNVVLEDKRLCSGHGSFKFPSTKVTIPKVGCYSFKWFIEISVASLNCVETGLQYHLLSRASIPSPRSHTVHVQCIANTILSSPCSGLRLRISIAE